MTIITTPPSVPDLLGTSPADLVRYRDLPESTADEATARANRIRARLESYIEIRQDIADAYAARDWAALEYGSWPEYVLAEFGPELQRLTREDRPLAVADRRAEGMSNREIGRVLKVSEGTVRNDLAQVRSDYAPEPRTVDGEVSKPAEPERVTGKDGKSYPAKKPTKPKPEPAAEDKPKPAPWTAEERKAHEEEVQLQKDRESARSFAKTFVTHVRNQVLTIVAGYRLGETGLVTLDDIAACRKVLDMLEKEVLGDAQR